MPNRTLTLTKIIALTGVLLASSLMMGCSKIVSSGFITHYTDPYHKKVRKAGFVEKTVQLGSVNLNYVEGPDNGPPLLMLHAQMMDWYSYSRVLPELSKSFHIFAVDVPGQGKTQVPAQLLNADTIGSDLGLFIETVVKQPCYVTGNSSGGLLTVWLAANRPALVKAILLEDPPLFSAEYPRVKQTIAYRSFTTCHTYVEENRKDDFLIYWLNSNSAFVEKQAGKKALPLLLSSIQAFRKENPGKPVELRYLPTTIRIVIRGFSSFDPHFGNAFYTGDWNKEFDHAAALKKIKCPTLLLQANYEILADGTLDGAMSKEEAENAMSLIPSAKYQKVDALHVVHLDKPDQFIQILKGFFTDK